MQTILRKIHMYDGYKEGVSLIEMVVAVAIFSLLTLLSIGSMIGVMNAERKAVVIKDVIDNARFSLELMTRELRTGDNYLWGGLSCPGQTGNGLQFISYNQGSPQRRFYYRNLAAGAIFRVAMPNSSPVDCNLARQFTAEEVVVDQFVVTLGGASALLGPADGQSRVTISMLIFGKSPKYGADTRMNLQTTITGRIRDHL